MEHSSTTGPGTHPGDTPGEMAQPGDLVIDCDSCTMRDIACHDCVVSVLLGPVSVPVRLVAGEGRALTALAASGLVPPLRHRARRTG